MFKRATIIGILSLLIVTNIALTQYDKSQDLLSRLLSPEQFQKFGLHKLSQEERNSLGTYFSFLVELTSLGDSAIEYLKNEGWEEIRVLGERRLALDEWSGERRYLIVEVRSRTFICRLGSSYSPGKYLGQKSGSTIDIIDRNGNKDWLRIEKEI
jgi:hypothetical protein